MKLLKLTFLFVLISNLTFGQNLDEETKVINQYKKEKRNQDLQKKIAFDISGICDAISSSTDQMAGIGWDDCISLYEGTIEFEAVDGNNYNVYSVSETGMKLNDMSFGSFYDCYEAEDQGSMPNNDANTPTLFFNVNEQGALSFTGASQWGEVYSLDNVIMDGPQLNFSWTNDYGEGGQVGLVRQDDQNWEELLAGCNICSETDSLALVALYNATGGPNWNIKWDLETPVRDWYGVTLNESCCVSEIDLGPSDELTNLGFITNNLVGEVPSELADLSSSLTILDLGSNSLDGEPLITISQLENLTILVLSSNLFSGTIPQEISNLQNLDLVSFSFNDFEGSLPMELSTIAQLRILFASSNNLEGEIPVEFGQFESLLQLSMWGNNFVGTIPAELGNIESLTNLTLEFNQLSGEIPASIAQLPALNSVRLSHNQLTGSLPIGFENLAVIRINDNNLTGDIPMSLASVSLLNGVWPFEVNFANNNFTGEVPHWLLHNTPNQAIYFGNNDFVGCFENIDNLCAKTFTPERDTLVIKDTMYLVQLNFGYDCTGNPKLAWEGDLQNACDGQDQITAPCDDGSLETINDWIDANCECVEMTVSTNNIDELNLISIAPNPLLKGQSLSLHLELNAATELNLSLLDITGKVLKQKALGVVNGKTSISIDSEGFDSGIYILQIASKNGVVIKKVVIN